MVNGDRRKGERKREVVIGLEDGGRFAVRAATLHTIVRVRGCRRLAATFSSHARLLPHKVHVPPDSPLRKKEQTV